MCSHAKDFVFILAFVRPNECMNCLIPRKQLRQPLSPDQVERLAPAHVVQQTGGRIDV